MDAQKDFDDFVKKVIAGLSKQLDRTKLSVSEDGNALRYEGFTVNLRSMFRQFVMESDHSQQAVDETVSTILESINDTKIDTSADFDSIRESLRPKLLSRMNHALFDYDYPYKLVGEHLLLTIVIDSARTMRFITHSVLKEWSVTLEEALSIALKNVSQASQFMGIAQKDDSRGHCSTATHDCYDSARFLLEQPFESFKIGYPRWAFPSARDMCCMANADYDEDLEFNIDMALDFGDNDPKPLPPFPLVDHGNGWTNWEPKPRSPLHRKLAKRQFAYWANGYSDIKHKLIMDLEEKGDYVLVESFQTWGKTNQTDFPVSFCNWPDGAEVLLRKTDCIVFPDRGNLRCSWKDVDKICSSRLMPAEAVYPPFWRTDGYPTDEEFERLESLSLD